MVMGQAIAAAVHAIVAAAVRQSIKPE